MAAQDVRGGAAGGRSQGQWPDPLRRTTVRRATIWDVARAAGVSNSTVSVALSGAPGVSARRRSEIIEIAERLGYVPDRRASRLRKGEQQAVGVVYDARQSFQTMMLDPIYMAAKEEGLTVILASATDHHSEQECLAELRAERCGALIHVGHAAADHDLFVTARMVPTCVLGHDVDSPCIDQVVSDSSEGLEQAVMMLKNLGHRHIVHVDAGPMPLSKERECSYTRAMDRAGLGGHVKVIHGGNDTEGGVRGAHALLALPELPTAVSCYNDVSAAALGRELLRVGVRIPEDVSIVGYDDAPVSADPLLPLTTIRQDGEALARASMSLVKRRIAEEHPIHQGDEEVVKVPTRLVQRGTVAPPRPGRALGA